MSKLIAILALLATSSLIMLGNFWFTFGIWPRSWIAFFAFWVLSVTNYALLTVITREK